MFNRIIYKMKIQKLLLVHFGSCVFFNVHFHAICVNKNEDFDHNCTSTFLPVFWGHQLIKDSW